MKAKREAQQLALELRRQGLSYREIMQHVQVSKSSVSLWCHHVELDSVQRQVLLQRKLIAGQQGLATIAQLRQSGKLTRRRPVNANGHEIERVRNLYLNERLGVREVAERMGVSFWRVYQLMRQHEILRRRGSEQNYVTYKHKPQFALRQALTREDEQLRIAGVMLYLGEGGKTNGLVDFTNCDPNLIKVFVTFLRRICGISKSRVRAHLYAYADQDIGQLQAYWSEATKIPLHQFIKPYVRQLTPNLSRRKMPFGLLHIRYSDKRLLQLILRWGQEFTKFWAGT